MAHCALALPHQLRVGGVSYATRDYVALRLLSDEGVSGYAYGYTRGGPLLQAVVMVAESVIGQDPAERRRLTRQFSRDRVALGASVTRGLSLVDIALWDVAAKQAGMPLHGLLGSGRDRVPAMAVCGYSPSRQAIVEEVDALAGEGFDTLKLMLAADEVTSIVELIESCLEILDGRAALAVDFHYSLHGRFEAARTLRALDRLPLAFVEDPFPPWRWRELAALGASTRLPIAAGEDVPDPSAYRDLVEAVDVLRVDATTCGGITSVLGAFELADAAGVGVVPHVFTPLNGQLAASYGAIAMVEVVPSASGTDPIDQLLVAQPVLEGGSLVVGRDAGCGIDLDWSAVRACAGQVVRLG
ncbi:MAG TPA: enolase C-terminal domain-like protein [Acidimicrobiales bacterium]|nr:enolase C-terminal domain-like protein [Acidimicrobiales bacterium]